MVIPPDLEGPAWPCRSEAVCALCPAEPDGGVEAAGRADGRTDGPWVLCRDHLPLRLRVKYLVSRKIGGKNVDKTKKQYHFSWTSTTFVKKGLTFL